jgi:hypothetical protein
MAPVGRPVRPPSGQKKIKSKNKKNYFLVVVAGWKRGEKYFGFRFSIPKIPEIPELYGLRGRSHEKKKVFSA